MVFFPWEMDGDRLLDTFIAILWKCSNKLNVTDKNGFIAQTYRHFISIPSLHPIILPLKI